MAIVAEAAYVPIAVVVEGFHNRIFECSTKWTVVQAVSAIHEWFSLKGGVLLANRMANAPDETPIEKLLRNEANVKLEFCFGRFLVFFIPSNLTSFSLFRCI
jgi:hypothetical protein